MGLRQTIVHLFLFFYHLGGFGLLGLGVLDSSFLFMPLGNDMLVVALTARHHERLAYYAAMAAVGSVLGCLLLDVVCRRLGEDALERVFSKKQLEKVRGKMEKRAGAALAFVSLMPPPFPFTPFIAASSLLKVPRGKMLAVIGVSRLARFLIVGSLAIVFGRHIIRWSKAPAFEYGMIGFFLLCVAGSAVSMSRWLRQGRNPRAVSPAAGPAR